MNETYKSIPLTQIEVNHKDNIRKQLEGHKWKLKNLAENIEENGLLSPVTVMQIAEGQYKLVAGYRRFEAYKILSEENPKDKTHEKRYTEIPVHIVSKEKNKLYLAISENLARKEMSEDEKAEAVYLLKESEQESVRKLADRLGISKSYVDKLYQRGKILMSLDGDVSKETESKKIDFEDIKQIMLLDDEKVEQFKKIDTLPIDEKIELANWTKEVINKAQQGIRYLREFEKKISQDENVKQHRKANKKKKTKDNL